MAIFRTKPTGDLGGAADTVNAAQWFKNGDHPDDYAEARDGFEHGHVVRFSGEECRAKGWEGGVVRYFRRPDVPGTEVCFDCGKTIHEHGWIETPEGGEKVCPGNWVITRGEGDYYPCQADIFADLYEPVPNRTDDQMQTSKNQNARWKANFAPEQKYIGPNPVIWVERLMEVNQGSQFSEDAKAVIAMHLGALRGHLQERAQSEDHARS